MAAPDLGACRLHLEAEIRRLRCKGCERVGTEDVPWPRPGARLTRDLEDLIAFMAQRMDEARAKNPKAQLRYRYVPYTRISVQLKRAMIAAEDAKFVEHEGFDWEGIQRAMDRNLRRGKLVSGGSTLTQQVAKNLFLSGERSLLRKAQEAMLAAMLEAAMDKRRIFEIYLNVAEWGENVFGAEAAAHYYFGVSAANLAPDQAARLAAMLPRPRYYDRNRGSAYLTNYSESILEQMPAAQVP